VIRVRGKNIKKVSIIAMLLLPIVILALPSTVSAPSPTTVSIDPSMVSGYEGVRFRLDIKVDDVTDLYTFGFKLKFPPFNWLLAFSGIEEGDFLKDWGPTVFAYKLDDAHGFIYVACTLYGAPMGRSGSGLLCSIEFTGVAVGESPLELDEVVLRNSMQQLIPCVLAHGYVEILAIDFWGNLIGARVKPSRAMRLSKTETATLYAICKNDDHSARDVYMKVMFEIVPAEGDLIRIYTNTAIVAPSYESGDLSVDLEIEETGTYYGRATCLYSPDDITWFEGAKTKTFSFTVRP
jgi:hypothetical protein